jgi:hypothetical protein
VGIVRTGCASSGASACRASSRTCTTS